MKKAVIDIGTNSVRLAMADVAGTLLYDLQEDILITRLGAAKQNDGCLDGSEVQHTLEACQKFIEQAVQWQTEELLLTATAAFREAANRMALQNHFKNHLGHRICVLSEYDEARFCHLGATADGSTDAVVLDIGGGSTECTWLLQGALRIGHMPIGALRLKIDEGLYQKLPSALSTLLPKQPMVKHPLIGTGGTITTLSAMFQGLSSYDEAKVNGYILQLDALKVWREKIAKLSPEARKNLPGLHPERADIILQGMDILLAVMTALNLYELQVSTRDGLHGRLLTPFCEIGCL